mgnify:FL=1
MTRATIKKRSQAADVWRRLKKSRLAMIGLFGLAVLVFCALFADLIAPYDYALQDYTALNQTPSLAHPFGTDNFGRDIFSRVIYGARISLVMGFISLLIGALVGCVLGAIAGFFGKRLESLIMRACDIMMSIPSTVLAIVITTTLGPGLVNAIIALSISTIPTFARVVRGSTLTVKDQEFIEAARCIGAKNSHIIMHYILPNVLAPIIVQATLGIGKSIIMLAALSFLGLGIQPPTPEWGSMLSTARTFMRDYPHEVIFPGLAIMFTVLSLNLFGDGLRDALDPKLKR